MPDDRERWRPADVVPRRMLELCKDTLRRCLAERVELQDRIGKLEAEVARLEGFLRAYRGR